MSRPVRKASAMRASNTCTRPALASATRSLRRMRCSRGWVGGGGGAAAAPLAGPAGCAAAALLAASCGGAAAAWLAARSCSRARAGAAGARRVGRHRSVCAASIVALIGRRGELARGLARSCAWVGALANAQVFFSRSALRGLVRTAVDELRRQKCGQRQLAALPAQRRSALLLPGTARLALRTCGPELEAPASCATARRCQPPVGGGEAAGRAAATAGARPPTPSAPAPAPCSHGPGRAVRLCRRAPAAAVRSARPAAALPA